MMVMVCRMELDMYGAHGLLTEFGATTSVSSTAERKKTDMYINRKESGRQNVV